MSSSNNNKKKRKFSPPNDNNSSQNNLRNTLDNIKNLESQSIKSSIKKSFCKNPLCEEVIFDSVISNNNLYNVYQDNLTNKKNNDFNNNLENQSFIIKDNNKSISNPMCLSNNNNNFSDTPNDNNNNIYDPNYEIKSKVVLINLGETSYLGSILQCLGNIEYLKLYFLNKNNISFIEKNIKGRPLSFVIERLFLHFYLKNKEKNYSPESILKALSLYNNKYNNNNSNNPNECLTFILNNLHNELNRLKNYQSKDNYDKTNRKDAISYGIRNIYNTNDSIISDIFNCLQIKENQCDECGTTIYDMIRVNTVQLDILGLYKDVEGNEITIENCISFESEKKKINLHCDICQKDCSMDSISSIYRSSKILTFLLDRGDFDEEKLKIPFNLEEEINLDSKIEDYNSPKKYELFGVVSVYINSNEKKYVSFCKCNSFKDKLWFYFNDEKVELIQQEKLVEENNNKTFIPCILFYKSIDEKK